MTTFSRGRARYFGEREKVSLAVYEVYWAFGRSGDERWGQGMCTAEWGSAASWEGILLFSIPDEELAPAVGHDETDAEEVVDWLEAPGGDVALWREGVSFPGWVGGCVVRMRTLYWTAS